VPRDERVGDHQAADFSSANELDQTAEAEDRDRRRAVMLLTASPPPLNGTRTKSMPHFLLKASMNATFDSEGVR
jgi:hypothetical protein